MNRAKFDRIEKYMLSCMLDAAHDKSHVYRVLYNALDIAKYETNVDHDLLITSCLLHDIGRKEQFENPALDHAAVGGDKAYKFLTECGEDSAFAEKVRECIVSHRFRKNEQPKSLEAKILFDADKLDVTGAMGIARTLVYKGAVNDPLYSLNENGMPSRGENDDRPSFFQEYNYKLKNLYSRFYTKRGAELAESRKDAARSFYENLYNEVSETYRGASELDKLID
ncbi:MAG: HD domain-containing protein [Clostridiales bacterium]|nr:HD domain-containing protein [Clostridiales bacterium]